MMLWRVRCIKQPLWMERFKKRWPSLQKRKAKVTKLAIKVAQRMIRMVEKEELSYTRVKALLEEVGRKSTKKPG